MDGRPLFAGRKVNLAEGNRTRDSPSARPAR